MTIKSQKWGNSVGVRLPKALLKELGLQAGAEFDICIEHRKLVFTPKKSKKTKELTLDDLLDSITPGQLHSETDWGKPVGKEIW
jgi:antitoxin MazE